MTEISIVDLAEVTRSRTAVCVCIDTDELRSSIPVGIDSTSKAVGLEEEAETTAKEDKAARSV